MFLFLGASKLLLLSFSPAPWNHHLAAFQLFSKLLMHVLEVVCLAITRNVWLQTLMMVPILWRKGLKSLPLREDVG